MDLTERQIKREEIYDGKVLHVVKDTVLLPDGKESIREFCLHVGAVAVLPLTDDGRVAMVRQYRYAHGRVFLEVPAGKLDYKEEIPLEAAKRELREETGAVAENFTYLGVLDTTPALLDEKIHLYLAEGLKFGNTDFDEDEFLECELIPLTKLVDMVMSGEIRDGKTQILILKAAKIKGML